MKYFIKENVSSIRYILDITVNISTNIELYVNCNHTTHLVFVHISFLFNLAMRLYHVVYVTLQFSKELQLLIIDYYEIYPSGYSLHKQNNIILYC